MIRCALALLALVLFADLASACPRGRFFRPRPAAVTYAAPAPQYAAPNHYPQGGVILTSYAAPACAGGYCPIAR